MPHNWVAVQLEGDMLRYLWEKDGYNIALMGVVSELYAEEIIFNSYSNNRISMGNKVVFKVFWSWREKRAPNNSLLNLPIYPVLPQISSREHDFPCQPISPSFRQGSEIFEGSVLSFFISAPSKLYKAKIKIVCWLPSVEQKQCTYKVFAFPLSVSIYCGKVRHIFFPIQSTDILLTSR